MQGHHRRSVSFGNEADLCSLLGRLNATRFFVCKVLSVRLTNKKPRKISMLNDDKSRTELLTSDRILIYANGYDDFVTACDLLSINRKKASYLIDYHSFLPVRYNNPVLIIYGICKEKAGRINVVNEFKRHYQGNVYHV